MEPESPGRSQHTPIRSSLDGRLRTVSLLILLASGFQLLEGGVAFARRTVVSLDPEGLISACHDSLWDPGEYCGHDALLVTGEAEMNHDCRVDYFHDLVLLAGQLHETGAGLSGDLDGNGIVDASDVGIFAASLGHDVMPCDRSTRPDSTAGVIAMSFSGDPANIVGSATMQSGPGVVYVVVDSIGGAHSLEYAIRTSSNVMVTDHTILDASAVDVCDPDFQQTYRLVARDALFPVGPLLLARVEFQLMDTQPASFELVALPGCPEPGIESSLRWSDPMHDRSTFFEHVSNAVVNSGELIVDAGPDLHVGFGESVHLHTFVRGGQQPLDVEWLQVPFDDGSPDLLPYEARRVVFDDRFRLDPAFTAPEFVETLAFRVTVRDGAGGEVTDVVNVTVLEDVSSAVFVSKSLGADGAPGTMEMPLRSIGEALRRMEGLPEESRQDIYIHATGPDDFYDETDATLTLTGGTSLYGGFDAEPGANGDAVGWTRMHIPNPAITKSGARTDPSTTSIHGAAEAISIKDVIMPTIIDGLHIRAMDGRPLPGWPFGWPENGENSIGMHVVQASSALQITNNIIEAGHGGRGGNGRGGRYRLVASNRGGWNQLAGSISLFDRGRPWRRWLLVC